MLLLLLLLSLAFFFLCRVNKMIGMSRTLGADLRLPVKYIRYIFLRQNKQNTFIHGPHSRLLFPFCFSILNKNKQTKQRQTK
jgi:hypothetical protein